MSHLTVHKFQFNSPYHLVGSPVIVYLPRNATPLTLELQNDVPTMWYAFDPVLSRREQRLFLLVMTGHDYDLAYKAGTCRIKQHVGTAMNNKHDFVVHLFEVEAIVTSTVAAPAVATPAVATPAVAGRKEGLT